MNFIKSLIQKIKQVCRDLYLFTDHSKEKPPRNDLIHKKDTKFFCAHCNDFVMQSCKDIFYLDDFRVSQFYNDKGQAPFISGSKFVCKKCHEDLWPSAMIKDH